MLLDAAVGVHSRTALSSRFESFTNWQGGLVRL